MRKTIAGAALMLALFVAGFGSAYADALSGYSHYRTLTAASGKVTGTHTDEVVMVEVATADFPQAHASGYDIRFTMGDGTFLHHELNQWSGGVGRFFVKAADLADGEVLEIHYGNADSTTVPPVRGTWNDYAAVFHYDEDPTTNNRLTDSSGNGAHATLGAHSGFSWQTSNLTAGTVGGAWKHEEELVTTNPNVDVTGSWELTILHKYGTGAQNGVMMLFPHWAYYDVKGPSDWVFHNSAQATGDLRIWCDDFGTGSDGTTFFLNTTQHIPNTDDGFRMWTDGVELALRFEDASQVVNDGWLPIGTFNDDFDIISQANGATEPLGAGSQAYTSTGESNNDRNDGWNDELWIRDGISADGYKLTRANNLLDNATFWVLGDAIEAGTPDIRTVTGTLEEAETVTLAGFSFGTRPTVSEKWTYDEFDSLASGTNIITYPSSEWVQSAYGYGLELSTDDPLIDNSISWSGNNSLYCEMDGADGTYSTGAFWQADARTYDRIYFSYWAWFDPYSLPASSTQWKMWRAVGNLDGYPIDNNSGSVYRAIWIAPAENLTSNFFYCACGKGCTGTPTVQDCASTNTLPASPQLSYMESSHSTYPMRQWVKVQVEIDGGTPDVWDGRIRFGETGPSTTPWWPYYQPGGGYTTGFVEGPRIFTDLTDGATCDGPSDFFEWFILQGYFDETPQVPGDAGADLWIDDLHIQFGSFTRVQVIDDPDYFAASVILDQKVESWADGQVQFTAQLEGVNPGVDDLYVVVVGHDGALSAPVSLADIQAGAAILAPTGLSARAISSSQVNLAWTDNATDELGYTVEVSLTSSTTGFIVIAALRPNSESFNAAGLQPNTVNRWYRVRAYNAAEYSNYTSAVQGSTPPASN